AGALKIRLLQTGQETTCAFCFPVEEAEAAIGRKIELQHFGWMPSGKVRHPGMIRFRPDLEDDELPPPPMTVPVIGRMTCSWMRNYGAMGDEKLIAAVASLKKQSGDAYERAIANNGDVADHLERARGIAARRGLVGQA
ncbi:MAG: hypothetical protein H0T76_06270, partial [Nannocystis sp.]